MLCCCSNRSVPAKPRRFQGQKSRKKGEATGNQLIFSPTGEHTHTVIMLHGSYYNGTEFEDLPALVEKEAKRLAVDGSVSGIKYIFPHSPQNADGENFWYDYEADEDAEEMQCDNDVINLEQWNTQVQRIADLVDAEVAALGDPKKVIVGGNSAGGGLAIHVTMQSNAPLAALICLRTCPMRHSLGPAVPTPVTGEPDGALLTATKAKGMPVLVYQAGKDNTYVPLLQARNYAFIEAAGFSVEYKVKPNGTHEEDDPEENPQVAAWIVSSFFHIDV